MCSRAPELWKLNPYINEKGVSEEERKEILLKADVFALGILISDILLCKLNLIAWKGTKKRKVNDITVRMNRGFECSGARI